MKIERDVFHSDNVVATVEFKKNCLNCKDCKVICRQFFELRTIPETVLKAARK